MSAHTLLVSAYMDGAIQKPGSTIDYAGPPNWKFEPLDPAARATWDAEAADPARVEAELKRTGQWDYDAPPPPPQPYERGYTPEIIAGLTPPEPPYNRHQELG